MVKAKDAAVGLGGCDCYTVPGSRWNCTLYQHSDSNHSIPEMKQHEGSAETLYIIIITNEWRLTSPRSSSAVLAEEDAAGRQMKQ